MLTGILRRWPTNCNYVLSDIEPSNQSFDISHLTFFIREFNLEVQQVVSKILINDRLSLLLFLFLLEAAVGAVGTVGNSTFFGEFSKRCGNRGKTQFVFPLFP